MSTLETVFICIILYMLVGNIVSFLLFNPDLSIGESCIAAILYAIFWPGFLVAAIMGKL